MNDAILISPHVINTIKSLPAEERVAIASALTGELILGSNPANSLSPMQEMIYSIIRFYIKQDTLKYKQSQEALELSEL